MRRWNRVAPDDGPADPRDDFDAVIPFLRADP